MKFFLFVFLLLICTKPTFAGISTKNANYCLTENSKNHNSSFSVAENPIKNNPKKKKNTQRKSRKKGVKYYIFAVLIASTMEFLD